MPETQGSEHSEPKRAMDYSAVPEELRNACIWLPFRTRPRRSGDPADVHKVPYDADGRGADYPNPEVWMPFDKALEMFSTDAYEGIGICTTESMGYVLVDFDDCVEDGVIAPDVIELIRQLDTYTEWSYSGTGVHLIAKGKWFSGHKASTQTGTIEVYDSKRFFVVTGEILEGSRSTIEPRQDVIDYVDRSYDFSARTNRRSGATQRSKAPVEVTVKCDKPPLFTDEAVIRAIDQLWLLNRYWNGWRGPDEDASSADFALGCGLAFLTDHNVNQMRRLMMQSKLNRPKYQTRRGHSDYLGYTLEKCIGRVSGSWDGSYDSLPPSSVNYGSELIADRKDPCAAGATSCANNRLNSGACPKDTLNRPNDCEVEPEPLLSIKWQRCTKSRNAVVSSLRLHKGWVKLSTIERESGLSHRAAYQQLQRLTQAGLVERKRGSYRMIRPRKRRPLKPCSCKPIPLSEQSGRPRKTLSISEVVDRGWPKQLIDSRLPTEGLHWFRKTVARSDGRDVEGRFYWVRDILMAERDPGFETERRRILQPPREEIKKLVMICLTESNGRARLAHHITRQIGADAAVVSKVLKVLIAEGAVIARGAGNRRVYQLATKGRPGS